MLRTAKKAAKHQLGPEVYGNIITLNRSKVGHDYIYGYITEIVPIVNDKMSYTLPRHPVFEGTDCNGLCHFYDGKNFNRCNSLKQLRRDLKTKIGFIFDDDHDENVGLKNGQFVCIDFGIEDGRYSI